MFRKNSSKGKRILDSGVEEKTCDIVLPKKRNRGIAVSSVISDLDYQQEEPDNFSKKFIKSKSQIDQIHKNHLDRYIKETLNTEKIESQQKPEEILTEELLFEVPEKYRIDNSRITEGSEKTLWQSGIIEIPLSLDYKLDNIEATEAVKRRAIKENSAFHSRFDELHMAEYEKFNARLDHTKNYEKTVERFEKKMTLRGKRYKTDKEERIKQNEKLESYCASHPDLPSSPK